MLIPLAKRRIYLAKTKMADIIKIEEEDTLFYLFLVYKDGEFEGSDFDESSKVATVHVVFAINLWAQQCFNVWVLWNLIMQYHREELPNLIILAILALSHHVHTSDCERAAHKMVNLVTTPLRNCLAPETCDILNSVSPSQF